MPERDEAVIGAFSVFDTNQDWLIEVEEFRHVMSNLGEKLTDAEIDKILGEFAGNIGKIPIKPLVKKLMEIDSPFHRIPDIKKEME